MYVQIASRAMATRTERMQRCTQQTERTSTARRRTPCWTPWRLQRRSMMPGSSQVTQLPHGLWAIWHILSSSGCKRRRGPQVFCQLCVRDYQGVDLLLLRRRGTPLEANACPTVTCWTFADPKRLSGMIEEALYSSSHAPALPPRGCSEGLRTAEGDNCPGVHTRKGSGAHPDRPAEELPPQQLAARPGADRSGV